MFGQTNHTRTVFPSSIGDFVLSGSAGWTATSLYARRSFKFIIAFVSLFLLVACFALFYSPPTFRRPPSPFANSQADRTPAPLATENITDNHHHLVVTTTTTTTTTTTAPSLSLASPPTPLSSSLTPQPPKPNFKIVAVIFYGRPDRVEILDCYLKRNLVANGGWLDEVYWAPNTENQADLDWLDKLVPTSPSYKIIPVKPQEKGYAKIWDHTVSDPDTLYIKIDDDIIFIDDNAIPKLVSLKLEHDHSFLVSANVINGAPLPYHHYRTGAIRPYLPELAPPNNNSSHNITNNTANSNVTSLRQPTWRASQLPYWEGADGFEFPLEVGNAPYANHRWLPVHSESRTAIYRTPIQHALCSPWAENRGKWSLAAQQHFSFLESLERNATDVYDFARRGVWDMGFERISINFIAIWGRDVIDHLPLVDDEAMLTKSIPKKLRRPVLVATGAIAAHYAFASQVNDLKQTDILSRYRAYANDMICLGTLP
ncbi:hypothetical protein BDDG_08350 [Blastomyces dermatitidis ATCC 18188]|uniref:Uncharacterized protein n=1 Tax=Ajellomyces dermatitidis (strain ATCC 18188 / CBS 674.68) TaxID=653446 RepID=F2TQ92_AJEDA|nr:hypothetical protein BDDG_08350 [Blastomyces dermatitidis ATCC 18188]